MLDLFPNDVSDSPSPIHQDPFVAPQRICPKSQLGLFDRVAATKDSETNTPAVRPFHSQSTTQLDLLPRRPRSRPNEALPSRLITSEVLPDRSRPDESSTDLKRTISGKIAQPRALDPGAPQRKSVRLLNQLRPQTAKTSILKTDREFRKAKAPSIKGRNTVGREVSGNRMPVIETMDVDEKKAVRAPNVRLLPAQKGHEAAHWLLDLLSKLGNGYFALSHYRCQDAIRIFQSVVPNQRDTPWVLAQIGRAYFEQASYAEAEKIFACIRAVVPSQHQSMEFYSSTLWHRKNEVDLAYLAHELVDLDRYSPQAWCAVGNSFSLQRDHDQALKCFKRATQLDPAFAYAYTLQGHEHLANEEYDKSLAAFRSAVSAENRHYNAWYGIGRVLEKQGKYRQAEEHYRTAANINPTNAILLTCIGVVLEKQSNPRSALVKYSEAVLLAERNALPRFKKAKVLMTLNRPQSALAELLVLKDLCPDEANVHFTLGTVYKVLRQKGEAVRHFTMALNLDPKASHFIKEAMEQIQDEED